MRWRRLGGLAQVDYGLQNLAEEFTPSPGSVWPAGVETCSLGSAVSRRDLWELAAYLSRLVETPAAGEYTRAKALPEESLDRRR